MKIKKAVDQDAYSIAIIQVTSSNHAYKNILPNDHLAKTNIVDRHKVWLEIIAKNDSEIFIFFRISLQKHNFFSR